MPGGFLVYTGRRASAQAKVTGAFIAAAVASVRHDRLKLTLDVNAIQRGVKGSCVQEPVRKPKRGRCPGMFDFGMEHVSYEPYSDVLPKDLQHVEGLL